MSFVIVDRPTGRLSTDQVQIVLFPFPVRRCSGYLLGNYPKGLFDRSFTERQSDSLIILRLPKPDTEVFVGTSKLEAGGAN